jgi:Antibiotic biosynthesis monooxygenase
MQLREMDEQVTYIQQLQEDAGPIVLVNVFNVAPEDAERLLEAWADDAAFMKQQPGFVSTQLHRGTAGSSTFVNVAEWESASALRRVPLARLPRPRLALPGGRRRVSACVQEGCGSGHLRRVASTDRGTGA